MFLGRGYGGNNKSLGLWVATTICSGTLVMSFRVVGQWQVGGQK